jgi:hypothetical protein
MNIFKRIKKVIVKNPKVLSKNGEKITEWEQEFFEREGKKSGMWKCANCESDYLCSGPEGGMSQNIRCRTCGQGYNISPFGIDNIGINESWIDPERLRALKLNKIKDKI